MILFDRITEYIPLNCTGWKMRSKTATVISKRYKYSDFTYFSEFIMKVRSKDRIFLSLNIKLKDQSKLLDPPKNWKKNAV
jgi:hypothetical protein